MKFISIHGGHTMTHPRGWSPYWTGPFLQKTGYEFILRQMTFFQSFPDLPLRLEAKYREAILKRDSRSFVCYQTWVRFFVFLDITAVFFVSLFVMIPLIRKGVFFCLHSFSSVSVKMSLFYFHSINSGSKVDRMFLVF